MKQYMNPAMLHKWRAVIIGLARDYWKDGATTPTVSFKKFAKKSTSTTTSKTTATAVLPRWKANRLEVIEKMWGKGMSRPGDEALTDVLVGPLGLNKEMTLMDLAAGLGGFARRVATQYKTYVAGMEIDPEMAKRGMELSVAAGKAKQASVDHYDPANFVPPRHFDCFIARDIFYRIADREKFFKSIVMGLKPHGQIVFTDYLLEPEHSENEVIKAWLANESGANPLPLAKMVETWIGHGCDVRVNEDMSNLYRHEIVKGLVAFTAFLAKNPPDEATKPLVKHETEKWARRVAAMGQGLKYYRFYMIKK